MGPGYPPREARPPIVSSVEQRNATEAALDAIYRSERGWRKLALVTILLGAGAIALDYRASGGVLMFLSVLCQLISWAAMRTARRIHDRQMGVL